MKKTKLFTSIAALALVLGLGACEVNVGDVNIGGDSSETTETESSESTSQSSETTESSEVTLPVLGEVDAGTYFLGFNMDNVDYYFNGTVYNTNYAGVTDKIGKAVPVTVAATDSGYSLAFTENEATVYLNMTESGTYRNIKWGSEVYSWGYDTTYSTFVALDSTDVYQYIGTYGTYKDLTLSPYGYLTGDLETTNAQYPAKLYKIPDDWEPDEGEEEPVTLPEGAYRLGVADTILGNYAYFTGISSNVGQVTTSWNDGIDVYVETTTTDDSKTGYALYYWHGTTKDYIGYSGSSTNLAYKTEPYYWAYDEENGVFVDTIETSVAITDESQQETGEYESSGRCLAYRNNSGSLSIRAYALSNLSNEGYFKPELYSEYPGILEVPGEENPSNDVLSIADLRAAITAGEVNATSGAVTFYGKIVARRDETNIYNGVYLQDGEDAVMLYSGSLSSLWTSESLSLGDDVLVTATYSSYNGLSELLPSKIEKIDGNEYNIAEPVTWTPASTEWLAASESYSGRLTTLDLIYNGGTISTTANTSLTMKFADDQSKEATVYFYSNMGSTYLEEIKAVFDDLVVGDHIKLTGVVGWFNGIQLAPHYIYNIENNADCLEVLNTTAPTSITITGADEVNVGFTTTLEAVLTGENYDQHVVWTSSSAAATVDENGKVTGNYAETGVTITATSRVDSSVYGTKTINVVELSTGVQVQDTLDKTANDLGTEFTRSDGSAYTFGSNNGSQTDYIVDGTVFEYTYVSFTWNNGSASTGTRFWSATPNQIRIYPNAYFTISTNNGATLDKIVITCASSSGNASHLSIDSGAGQLSVSSNVVTITPADGSTSITIKEAGDSNHCRMQEFAITYTYTV